MGARYLRMSGSASRRLTLREGYAVVSALATLPDVVRDASLRRAYRKLCNAMVDAEMAEFMKVMDREHRLDRKSRT